MLNSNIEYLYKLNPLRSLIYIDILILSCVKFIEHVFGNDTVWILARMPTSRSNQFYGLPQPVRVYSLFRRCSGRLSDSVVSFNRDVMKGVNDVSCQFCLQTYSNYSSFWIPGCWTRRSSESLHYVTQDFAFCRQKYRLRHCLSQMQLGAVWSVIMHLFCTGKSLKLC